MQLISLQILRAVAAWLVVYHHYMQSFHHGEAESILGSFFARNGTFGVHLFFVLSGFIMVHTLQHRHYEAGEFFKRRLLRIVPVYWCMTFLFIIASTYTFIPPLPKWDWSLESTALSLFFIPHDNPGGLGGYPALYVGWTLNFEIFFYAWLSLMLFVSNKTWLPACAISLFLFPLLWPSDWPYAEILGNRVLWEFEAGMLIGSIYFDLRKKRYLPPPYIGLLFVTIGIIFLTTGVPYLWRYPAVNAVLTASFFFLGTLILEQAVDRMPFLDLWRRLGDMSYSTYLVHPITLIIALYLFGHPQSWQQELLALSGYTLLTWSLSVWSYRMIENGQWAIALKRKFISSPPRVAMSES